MCTWFCETFCCFFLRFRSWLQYRRDHAARDDHLESGDSIYALPDLSPRYQQHQPQPPRPLPMPTIYPGGPPASLAPKSSPPRLNPRSVPLPVNYPPAETPTGKNFSHRSAPPNRMKPLPPLRTTFDGGGSVEGRRGTDSVRQPSSSTSFTTPAAPSESLEGTAVSVPIIRGARGFPFLQQLDKPLSIEVSQQSLLFASQSPISSSQALYRTYLLQHSFPSHTRLSSVY
ncbi:hypothetical protein XPA_001310 [Xanthoria parietina]